MMTRSVQLNLAVARRNVTATGLANARAAGAQHRVEQLERELARLDGQIAELSDVTDEPRVPERRDVDD